MWTNLRYLLENKPLKDYVPQRGFLKLLNTGDGRAIVEYKWFSRISKLGWTWKNWIDKRFMLKFQDVEPSMDSMSDDDSNQPEMRCVGCGGKVGGDVLSQVIKDLDIKQHPDVLVGLANADDAAIVKTSRETVVTTDFFATPIDDPWLMGRVSVLNSLSDCYAMGAKPTAALANVQVPFGSPRRQKEILFEVMKGAVDELNRAGASLVGGHSIEGPRLVIGFTVLASPGKVSTKKSGLTPGDQLILTKPLGTGALLAAHMDAKCHALWMTEMIQSMLLSNSIALSLMQTIDIHAMTDVTGFGLAGHLREMLAQSNCSAKIQLEKIRLLNGFTECINDGIESTMAEENRSIKQSIAIAEGNSSSPQYAAVFDPQTSGGLLIGCNPDQTEHTLQLLSHAGFVHASEIGTIEPLGSSLISFC